ncbi:MAG: MotA/TolQ/ExbB proton channel family protein [Candidatus Delongbacteria bacterium]
MRHKLATPMLALAGLLMAGCAAAQETGQQLVNPMVVLLKATADTSQSGFWFYWLIWLCGLAIMVIFVERLISVNFKSNIDSAKFSADIFKLIKSGEVGKAYKLAESMSEKALAYIYARALKEAAEREVVDYRNIQNAVDEAALEIIPRLEKRTGWLQTLSNVATLLGLMGTIYGLIQAFTALENADAASKGALLAKAIGTAMLTTLHGLVVAVPGTLAFAFINNKTKSILNDVDEYSVKLIHLITGSK